MSRLLKVAVAFVATSVGSVAGCGKEAPTGEPPAVSEAKPAPAAVPVTVLQTSRPSAQTRGLVGRVRTVKVVTFFPPGAVRDQVRGYFAELGVAPEELDQVVDQEAARKYQVRDNGAIVLASGERSRVVLVHPEDGPRADRTLRRLDEKIWEALSRLLPPKRAVVYAADAARDLERVLDPMMATLTRGLDDGAAIPAETDVVIYVDDGKRPTAAGLQRVAAHVTAGGHALLALEPAKDRAVAGLLEALGVELVPIEVASEGSFVVLQQNRSDRLNLATAAFGSHPAVATMAKGRQKAMFPGTGSLDVLNPATPPVTLVRSAADSFRDGNRNFERDKTEAAGPFTLAVATEVKGRVVVYADASWLDPQVLRGLAANQLLLLDAARWLAGAEAFTEAPGKPDLTTYAPGTR